ncbi:MAG: response regulator [Pseudomonadota bacterium]
MAKILVVDDETQIQDLLKMLLEGLGHSVKTADNGSIGLKLLSHEHFDLVITDIFMPEKEGLETIIEIKRDFPAVKVIAISGGNGSGCDYLPFTRPLGASGCLNKPFTNHEIVTLVQELLG